MELISKKKLLETIEPMVGKFDDDGEFWWSRESILRAINNAPTIEERKEGHWIDTGENLHKCTNCGHIIFSQTRYDLEEFHAYCGRCGARMKGE